MRRIAVAAIAAVTASGLAGCSTLGSYDIFNHREHLEESQKKYTQFMRWGEFVAAADFVDPELRSSFLDEVEAFEDVRISDYEIRYIEPNDELTEAEVRVSYTAFHLRSLVQQRFFETQNWYRGEGDWMVRPDLADLRANLQKLQP